MEFISLDVEDFEGTIFGFLQTGPSESLVLVRRAERDVCKKGISGRLKEARPSLKQISSPSDALIGNYCIAHTSGTGLERALCIRRPVPTTFQVYVVDEGTLCGVKAEGLFEMPEGLASISAFSCVCPVRVPYREQQLMPVVGLICQCIVESTTQEPYNIPAVAGLLMVQLGDRTVPLDEVVDLCDGSQTRSAESASDGTDVAVEDARGTPDAPGSSRLREKRRSRGRRNTLTSNKISPTSFFNHTAYETVRVDRLPHKLWVRFEKANSTQKCFWVSCVKAVEDVEKTLGASTQLLSSLPTLKLTEDGRDWKGVPCVTLARVESRYDQPVRIAVARFDSDSENVCVFLVDYGCFKWVARSTVIDVSSLEQGHPIVALPTALIHCREKDGTLSKVSHMERGTQFEVTLTEHNKVWNIYTVIIGSVSGEPPHASSATSVVDSISAGVHNAQVLVDTLASEVGKMCEVNDHFSKSRRIMMETMRNAHVAPSFEVRPMVPVPTSNTISPAGAAPWAGPNGGSNPPALILPMLYPVPVPVPQHEFEAYRGMSTNNTGETPHTVGQPSSAAAHNVDAERLKALSSGYYDDAAASQNTSESRNRKFGGHESGGHLASSAFGLRLSGGGANSGVGGFGETLSSRFFTDRAATKGGGGGGNFGGGGGLGGGSGFGGIPGTAGGSSGLGARLTEKPATVSAAVNSGGGGSGAVGRFDGGSSFKKVAAGSGFAGGNADATPWYDVFRGATTAAPTSPVVPQPLSTVQSAVDTPLSNTAAAAATGGAAGRLGDVTGLGGGARTSVSATSEATAAAGGGPTARRENSKNNGDENLPLWEKYMKDAKRRHAKGHIPRQKNRMTAWEIAVAEDRASRGGTALARGTKPDSKKTRNDAAKKSGDANSFQNSLWEPFGDFAKF